MSFLSSFDGVIGLSRLKACIASCLSSCKIRGAPFPHSLLCGNGGTGKTMIARSIASFLGHTFFEIEAAELRNREVAQKWILDCNDAAKSSFILFCDEIHRLERTQEAFYYPMEDRIVNRRQQRIKLHPFTLIGATTRRDKLDQGSFLNRFKNVWDIERYSLYETELIIQRYCKELGLEWEIAEVSSIARRSLGIPRIAKNLTEKVRDQVLHNHPKLLYIKEEDVLNVFAMEEIDDIGLRTVHRMYMEALSRSDIPKGVGVLSAELGMNRNVVEDSIEPILMTLGYVTATSRGRVLTEKGRKHLKL